MSLSNEELLAKVKTLEEDILTLKNAIALHHHAFQVHSNYIDGLAAELKELNDKSNGPKLIV